MKITENFFRKEFDCHDGTAYPEEWIESRLGPLCEALEQLRARIAGPIMITSGYRTPSHNQRVGGTAQSQHLTGRAADLRSSAARPREIGRILEQLIQTGKIPEGGLGVYASFVHYDIRGTKARW